MPGDGAHIYHGCAVACRNAWRSVSRMSHDLEDHSIEALHGKVGSIIEGWLALKDEHLFVLRLTSDLYRQMQAIYGVSSCVRGGVSSVIRVRVWLGL